MYAISDATKKSPEKCNVSLASIKNRKHIKVKVWERGAGLTKACGTAACATAVAGSILNLNERCVDIEFSEGLLNINWSMDNNIHMKGKVSEVEKIMGPPSEIISKNDNPENQLWIYRYQDGKEIFLTFTNYKLFRIEQ